MIEKEAKTKWCPFVRTGLTAGMAVNRHVADAPGAIDGVHDETRCIGSACMMWRWDRDKGWTLKFEGGRPVLRRPEGDDPHGFCGLAYSNQ